MRLYSCNPLIIRTHRGWCLHKGTTGQEQLCNDPLHKFPRPYQPPLTKRREPHKSPPADGMQQTHSCGPANPLPNSW